MHITDSNMPRQAAMVKSAPRKRAPAKKLVSSRSNIGRMRGRGDYTYDKPGPWGRIGRQVGGYAGNLVASPYGLGPLGQRLGAKLGSYMHYIGKIFGSGDYVTSASQVKSNVLVNSSQVPAFADGSGSIRISHREYLGDIITSATAGAFNIQQFPINPGLAASFPWLSQVAGATFQQYRINGMVFEFRSTSADALTSANTALGTVVMSTDYDSKDSPFTTKQQMENTQFGVSCKPSSCMIHAIECARSQTAVSELYVRAYAVPSGADVRLYDMGNFYIATTGLQGTNVNIGELWVSYDITLFKPILQPPAYINPYAQYVSSNASGSAPLGTSRTVNPQDLIGLTFTNNQIQWPLTTVVGATYLISVSYVASTSSSFNRPVTTSGNGMYIGPGLDLWSPSTGAISSQATLLLSVQYKGGASNGNLPYVNIANFTWAVTSIVEADIVVNQVNGNYWPGSFTGQIAILGDEPSSQDEETDDVPQYFQVEEEKKIPVAPLSKLRIKA